MDTMAPLFCYIGTNLVSNHSCVLSHIIKHTFILPQVPSDFNGTFWNATSKLWHVWSILSYTYSDEHTATCIPETSKDGKITLGASATYNSAEKIKGNKVI